MSSPKKEKEIASSAGDVYNILDSLKNDFIKEDEKEKQRLEEIRKEELRKEMIRKAEEEKNSTAEGRHDFKINMAILYSLEKKKENLNFNLQKKVYFRETFPIAIDEEIYKIGQIRALFANRIKIDIMKYDAKLDNEVTNLETVFSIYLPETYQIIEKSLSLYCDFAEKFGVLEKKREEFIEEEISYLFDKDALCYNNFWESFRIFYLDIIEIICEGLNISQTEVSSTTGLVSLEEIATSYFKIGKHISLLYIRNNIVEVGSTLAQNIGKVAINVINQNLLKKRLETAIQDFRNEFCGCLYSIYKYVDSLMNRLIINLGDKQIINIDMLANDTTVFQICEYLDDTNNETTESEREIVIKCFSQNPFYFRLYDKMLNAISTDENETIYELKRMAEDLGILELYTIINNIISAKLEDQISHLSSFTTDDCLRETENLKIYSEIFTEKYLEKQIKKNFSSLDERFEEAAKQEESALQAKIIEEEKAKQKEEKDRLQKEKEELEATQFDEFYKSHYDEFYKPHYDEKGIGEFHITHSATMRVLYEYYKCIDMSLLPRKSEIAQQIVHLYSYSALSRQSDPATLTWPDSLDWIPQDVTVEEFMRCVQGQCRLWINLDLFKEICFFDEWNGGHNREWLHKIINYDKSKIYAFYDQSLFSKGNKGWAIVDKGIMDLKTKKILEYSKQIKVKFYDDKSVLISGPTGRISTKFTTYNDNVLFHFERIIENLCARFGTENSTPFKKDEKMFCPYCGKNILRTTKFCNYCGKENKYRSN